MCFYVWKFHVFDTQIYSKHIQNITKLKWIPEDLADVKKLKLYLFIGTCIQFRMCVSKCACLWTVRETGPYTLYMVTSYTAEIAELGVIVTDGQTYLYLKNCMYIFI